jgi:hypothetical protein
MMEESHQCIGFSQHADVKATWRIWMLIKHGNLETAIPSPEFYTDSPKSFMSSGENRTSRFEAPWLDHQDPHQIQDLQLMKTQERKDHYAIPRNVPTCQVVFFTIPSASRYPDRWHMITINRLSSTNYIPIRPTIQLPTARIQIGARSTACFLRPSSGTIHPLFHCSERLNFVLKFKVWSYLGTLFFSKIFKPILCPEKNWVT